LPLSQINDTTRNATIQKTTTATRSREYPGASDQYCGSEERELEAGGLN
jgi:hypothetical protein